MKLAGRLNSFKSDTQNVLEIIDTIGNKTDLNYLDLNYPEHFAGYSDNEIKERIIKNKLNVNGVALRFRKEFINGEFSNENDNINLKAISLCKEAIDKCKYLNGKIVTIWLGYDGFDYPFQIDYIEAWNKIKQAFIEITQYAEQQDIFISIEYKPFQPRAFSMIPDVATTLLMVKEVNSKNLGVTLDYCHMLMRKESPSYALSLVQKDNKLLGIHLNDGYGLNDDGFITGTINVSRTLEYIYYLKKFGYDGVIYFDTFPVRDKPITETENNVKLIKKYFEFIDKVGLEKIERIIKNNESPITEILLQLFNQN